MRIHLVPLFQSDDLLVIDKPPGLSVHNAGPDETDVITLAADQFGLTQVFPVHRLDKETSGVQVLARNESAARRWAERFQERGSSSNLKKIYVAVVRGNIAKPHGVWSNPLSDKAEGRINPQGVSNLRVPCETRFHVIKQNRYFSLLELDLRTGRQHQIRKHAALDRHAVVGDARYGEKAYNSKIAKLYKTDRLFLHCHRLSFENLIWESRLPDEFEQLMSPADPLLKE